MLEGEENLIKEAQTGRADCFGHLYDHYISRIYRFVLLKVSYKHEAEDLTHEIFLKAWKNIKGYKSQGFPFSSWLYQIARNQVIDYYRLKKNELSLETIDTDIVKVASSNEADLDRSLDVSRVKTMMKVLNSDQQDVLLLRFVEGLSHREIAEALHKSEGAVRLIQHRAINELKKLAK